MRPLNIAAHVRPRRLRIYNVGCPKTGTTTVPRMFADYRAGHEWAALQFLPIATAVLTGELRADAPRARRALRYRSLRYHMEIDAANFLTPVAGTLANLYPDAKFVLTVRDCFTWLDSRIAQDVRYSAQPNAIWGAYLDSLYNQVDGGFAPEESALEEMGVRSIRSYLSLWNRFTQPVIDAIEPDRLLVLRTEDLNHSAGELARFAGVPPATIAPTHANRRPKPHPLLAEVPRDFVVERCREQCSSLMERYWGADWHELADRLPQPSR